MASINPQLESCTMATTIKDHFPFTKLPGELRNKVYREVLLRYERPKRKFLMSKTACKKKDAKRSTAWALTQVCRQLRAEFIPLVLRVRIPQVALCDLAEYLQVFHNGPIVAKPPTKKPTDCKEQQMIVGRPGYMKVWTSRAGLHHRLPSAGVNLLPILQILDSRSEIRFSFHSWCVWNWELAVIDTLKLTWNDWRDDIASLGIHDLHLRTEYGSRLSVRGRLSSSLTLQCKETKHTSEKKRVLDLCRWVYKTGLRKIHKRIKGFTVCFVTPTKTGRGQPSEVKVAVFESSVKLEWKCRGAYCIARLVDDGTESGFKIEKKETEGKDVLRL